MSPFCPGRTLASCPSPNAAKWRGEIRQWARDGVSTAEIRRRIDARVGGADLSGTPSGPLGWKLPVLVGAASVGLLGLLLYRLRSSRSRHGGGAEAEPAAGASPELDERLARELDALDADEDDE